MIVPPTPKPKPLNPNSTPINGNRPPSARSRAARSLLRMQSAVFGDVGTYHIVFNIKMQHIISYSTVLYHNVLSVIQMISLRRSSGQGCAFEVFSRSQHLGIRAFS